MITIFIEGGQLDVPAQEISTSFKSMRFSSPLQDAFSTDIELPKTAHNVRLLGAYGELDRGQLFGQRIECFVTSETRTDAGFLTIDRVTSDSITATVYFSVLPLELFDKAVREILTDDITTAIPLKWRNHGSGQWTSADAVTAPSQWWMCNSEQIYGGLVTEDSVRNAASPASIRFDDLMGRIATKLGVGMPSTGSTLRIVAKNLQQARNVPSVCEVAFTHPHDNFSAKWQAQHGMEIYREQSEIVYKFDQPCTAHIYIFANTSVRRDLNDSDNQAVATRIFKNGSVIGIYTFPKGRHYNSGAYYITASALPTDTFKIETYSVPPVGDYDTIFSALYKVWTEGMVNTDADNPDDITIFDRCIDDYYNGGIHYQDNVTQCPVFAYQGIMQNIGDDTIKALMSSVCWQLGLRLRYESGALAMVAPDEEKVLRHAELVSYAPVFDGLGQHNKVTYKTVGDGTPYRSFSLINSRLKDEVKVQELVLYSADYSSHLYAPIYTWSYDEDGDVWSREPQELSGIVAGTEGSNGWLEYLKNPSFLGLENLGKVALLTLRTDEKVSLYDYVWYDGHKLMVVEGNTDEETGITEFTALEVGKVSVTPIDARAYSDGFDDGFN